jgi:hypothetical protein
MGVRLFSWSAPPMKIEISPPPMFAEIVAAFPEAAGPGILFAFGDTIHNPSGIVIPPALIAHEEVHGARQLEPNGAFTRTVNIERWWAQYLVDPEFRYWEEVMAHAAEYKAQLPLVRDRNRRAQLLLGTAKRLTAPLYCYGPTRPTVKQVIADLQARL